MSTVALNAPALRDPAWSGRLFWVIAFALLMWPLLVITEFKPWLLWDPSSRQVMGNFIGDFFPPAHAEEFLLLVAKETWRTVAVATVGIALALLLAIPLTLLGTSALSVSALSGRMARLPAFARQLIRWLLIVLRSVPELVWALVFVRVVGLGPTAGVIAIADLCGHAGQGLHRNFRKRRSACHAIAHAQRGRAHAIFFLWSAAAKCSGAD
jgi:phosphonate transport system permease protein